MDIGKSLIGIQVYSEFLTPRFFCFRCRRPRHVIGTFSNGYRQPTPMQPAHPPVPAPSAIDQVLAEMRAMVEEVRHIHAAARISARSQRLIPARQPILAPEPTPATDDDSDIDTSLQEDDEAWSPSHHYGPPGKISAGYTLTMWHTSHILWRRTNRRTQFWSSSW